MIKAKVIDMVHPSPNTWDGVIKDWDHEENGRKRPVIKKSSNSLMEVLSPFRWSADLYPYKLVDDNVIHISNSEGFDVVILIPDTDIPDYSQKDFKNSFYAKNISGSEGSRLQKLRTTINEKEDEIQRLQRELDKAKSEEEEKKSSGSSGPPMHECSYCEDSSRKQDWKDSDKNKEDFCPKCGQGSFDNAKKVN